MEKIKEQVSAIVVFNKTTLEELGTQYSELANRLSEGISKMKTLQVFTNAEVKEVEDYGQSILNSRYQEQKLAIVTALRENFEF